MSFAKVFSAQASVTTRTIVSIEADISRGLHTFSVVGLADKAVEESKDRVSAALKNSGFASPKTKNQKLTISLAPADVKKEGPVFDLPIALAYLRASGEIDFDPTEYVFVGELSLDGKLCPVSGILPITIEAQRRGFKKIIVPKANAVEAGLVHSISVFGATDLKNAIEHLTTCSVITEQPHTSWQSVAHSDVDFSSIRGQGVAKRALEIAVAGGHNISLYGPPGTGKTMLAKATQGILPPLTFEEVLEITSIHSVARTLGGEMISAPPFRSPHHTSSYTAIIGGGSQPKPGEITLAHGGILFMDEFLEFDRRVVDALRQPLEERTVTIARTKGSISFPARCMLIIAMNPCLCGNYGVEGRQCICSASSVINYQRKLSGPIIDRIDLWTDVSVTNHEQLLQKDTHQETSSHIQERIIKAREIQRKRFGYAKTNNEMTVEDISHFVIIDPVAQRTLIDFCTKFNLSARAHHRIIKVSQTICDLQEKTSIDVEAVLEAVQYRPKRGIRMD